MSAVALATHDDAHAAEMELIRECFDIFDANKDGEVNAEELKAGFEMFGEQRRRSSIRRMIDFADVNANDTIDFEEFVVLVKDSESMDHAIDQMKVQKEREITKRDSFDLEGEKLVSKTEGHPVTKDDISASIYGNFSAGEQIHETPSFVQAHIREFDAAIERVPDRKKKNMMLAKEKAPSKFNDAFKTMFLRCERFDVKKSVARFCSYWDYMVNLWGPEKAFLPCTQKGSMRDDQDALAIPFVVDTQKKDAHGQHIFFFDFRGHDSKSLDAKAMTRATWYIINNLAERDEEIQKNGAVFLAHCHSNVGHWNARVTKCQTDSLRKAAPVRMAAMHFCDPPPTFNIMFRIGRIFFGELGPRMKLVLGNEQEILDKLEVFGITKDVIPKQLGGDVVIDHVKWLQDQAALEEAREK